jgi:hypothetical protein
METRSAAIHRKMAAPPLQLPITGSAHKAANGRRPLVAATGTARSARARQRASGWRRARLSWDACEPTRAICIVPFLPCVETVGVCAPAARAAANPATPPVAARTDLRVIMTFARGSAATSRYDPHRLMSGCDKCSTASANPELRWRRWDASFFAPASCADRDRAFGVAREDAYVEMARGLLRWLGGAKGVRKDREAGPWMLRTRNSHSPGFSPS